MIYSGQIKLNPAWCIVFCIWIYFVPLQAMVNPVLYAQSEEAGGLLEMLEEEPPDEIHTKDFVDFGTAAEAPGEDAANSWRTHYLKASYRHYYRLQVSYSDDRYGVPFNPERLNQTRRTSVLNMYGSESKIFLADNMFTFLRFDYVFNQAYEHAQGEYSNTPQVELYEAYLSYQKGRNWIQAGGLQMKLGKVDFDSPIDVLHLRNSDKTNHLDRKDSKFIMPAVRYSIFNPKDSWTFYWGPFQRVNEDKQSLRANFGVRYQFKHRSLEAGVGLFRWLDPDSALVPTLEPESDSSSDTLVITLKDATIRFATVDVDMVVGDWILKADLGLFLEKNFHHINLQQEDDATTDVLDLETLALRHVAFAASLEKKEGRFFLMPVYSYRAVLDVPGNTHIYQYENRSEPVTTVRNLERHQIAALMSWDWRDNLSTGILLFYSFPFRRTGFSSEVLWKPSGKKSRWRFLMSHVNTDTNKMTGRTTHLNRIQTNYSLQF